MRLYVLLGVDVGLILLATSLGFVLRENFEITQVRFEAFLPYLCATFIMSVVGVSAAGLNKSIWRFSSRVVLCAYESRAMMKQCPDSGGEDDFGRV